MFVFFVDVFVDSHSHSLCFAEVDLDLLNKKYLFILFVHLLSYKGLLASVASHLLGTGRLWIRCSAVISLVPDAWP